MKILKSSLLHLILFCCIPVITLFAHNVREVELLGMIRSLFFSFMVFLIVFGIIYLVIRKKADAALITSIIVILFFSYGHVQTGLLLTKTILVQIGRNWVLLPIYGIIFIGSVLFILRKKFENPFIHSLLNIVALVLFLFPSIQITSYYIEKLINSRNEWSTKSLGTADHFGSDSTPDIYYIILDSYTRQDELLARYGFDNSPFINNLRDLGFYSADCSFANYPYTSGSMAATLNMDYLYNIANEPEDSGLQDPMYRLAQKSEVRSILKSNGYKIVAFSTGVYSAWLNWNDADVYYHQPWRFLTDSYLYPFETLFLDTTILRLPIRYEMIHFPVEEKNSKFSKVSMIVKNNQELLSNLVQAAKIKGPKFVYFHILIPHEPFIYLPDGTISMEDYIDENTGVVREGIDLDRGFINNTQFINNRMIQIIEKILLENETEPIIILQGDHAFSRENRYPILNAYYFPNEDYSNLYPTISPVNSFRVIFNTFFNLDYPILEDTSMWNKNNLPYSKKARPDLLPLCK